jgi:hypothetical protein
MLANLSMWCSGPDDGLLRLPLIIIVGVALYHQETFEISILIDAGLMLLVNLSMWCSGPDGGLLRLPLIIIEGVALYRERVVAGKFINAVQQPG